jgi:hypothetical protein
MAGTAELDRCWRGVAGQVAAASATSLRRKSLTSAGSRREKEALVSLGNLDTRIPAPCPLLRSTCTIHATSDNSNLRLREREREREEGSSSNRDQQYLEGILVGAVVADVDREDVGAVRVPCYRTRRRSVTTRTNWGSEVAAELKREAGELTERLEQELEGLALVPLDHGADLQHLAPLG